MSNGKLSKTTKKAVDSAQSKAILSLTRKVGKLQKIHKADRHYLDVAQSITPGNAAVIGHLSAIAQGDGVGDRTGNEIALRKIEFRATVIPNSSAQGDAGRFILFRWKGPCGAVAPQISHVLQSTTNIDSPYNPDYAESLVVLKDTKVYCSSGSGATGLNIQKMLGNANASYVGTTGSSFNEGQLFFVLLFAENTNKSTFSYFSRLTFSP